MKRKIIRQVEIEYEVDIDTDKLTSSRYTQTMENSWVKSEITSFFFNEDTIPTISEYCKHVSRVVPDYTQEDKNLHVSSDIKAKIVRDTTISNEEI